MSHRHAIVTICAAISVADCGWDASHYGDFITSAAGESVAETRVQQAGEIWPSVSIDKEIVFDAARFARPSPTGTVPGSANPQAQEDANPSD